MSCLSQADVDELIKNGFFPKKYCGENLNIAMKEHCHPLVLDTMNRKLKKSRKIPLSIVGMFSKLIHKCFQQLTLVAGLKSTMLSTSTRDSMKMKIFRVPRSATAMTGSLITFTIRICTKGATALNTSL